MSTNDQPDDLRRIEDEAREQVRAGFQAGESEKLAVGQLVAWAIRRANRTDGFSAVHRIGEPIEGAAFTLCGEVVPPATQHVALSPRLVGALGECRYCEALYKA